MWTSLRMQKIQVPYIIDQWNAASFLTVHKKNISVPKMGNLISGSLLLIFIYFLHKFHGLGKITARL